MKVLIILCLLFGYILAAQDCGEVNCGGECSDALCGDGCVVNPNEPGQCTSEGDDDPTTTEMGETLETVECDDDDELANWTVEYIGKSTQWRILNPCNNDKITFKMEDLTEYDSKGKKTGNKETSFASIKDWETGSTAGYEDADGVIRNVFVADELTKVDASFKLTTDFFRTSMDITDPNDANNTITVQRNDFKFSVEIENWQTETDGNYLELCVTIKTNSKGSFDRDENAVSNGLYSIDNPTSGTCGGNDINVELTEGGNGNNQLSLCYKFDACDGAEPIYYDPIISMEASGSYISVFAVCVMSIMSLFFV